MKKIASNSLFFESSKVFQVFRFIFRVFQIRQEALVGQSSSLTPVVASEAVSSTTAAAASSAVASSSASCLHGGNTESPDPTPPVREPVVKEIRSWKKGWSSKFLGVLEHEEKVEVADQDPDQVSEL